HGTQSAGRNAADHSVSLVRRRARRHRVPLHGVRIRGALPLSDAGRTRRTRRAELSRQRADARLDIRRLRREPAAPAVDPWAGVLLRRRRGRALRPSADRGSHDRCRAEERARHAVLPGDRSGGPPVDLLDAAQRGGLVSAATNLDRTFAALADPTRRRVVDLLRKKPRRAGELAAAFGMSPPAMSRHLRVLRKTSLVEEDSLEEDARVRIYRLRPEAFAELRGWLSEVEAFWGGQLAAFKRSEEHTSELQSRGHLVCRLLL